MAATAAVGVAASMVPFASSLGPSAKARAAHELRIPLADIPSGSYKDIYWGRKRVFFGRFPELRAFFIYCMNDACFLPDPTWERPVVPCRDFAFKDQRFKCSDQGQMSWWSENAQWNERGEPVNPYFPPMQKVTHVVRNGEIILGEEQ